MNAPAISLEKVQAQAPSLVKPFQKAGISLSKRGLAGIRAQVIMLLDHSGSMYADYENGKVQQLVDRALAFGLNVDTDGEIEIIPFDSTVKAQVTASLGNYQGIVGSKIYNRNHMGSTNLTDALKEVQTRATKSLLPIYCMVVTDGEPDYRPSARTAVCQLARYPVFIKFLAIRPVSFLQELDDLDASMRMVDNVDAKFLPDVARMTDMEFSEAMADEWDTWFTAVRAKGILPA